MNADEPDANALAGGELRRSLPPYRLPVDDLIDLLETRRARGLSPSEAKTRLHLHGPNELPAPRPVPEWVKFLRQFADPLIILLLFATVISLTAWLIEGAHGIPYETLTIVAIVIFNSLLGYLQERHAEEAVAALKAMAAPILEHRLIVRPQAAAMGQSARSILKSILDNLAPPV